MTRTTRQLAGAHTILLLALMANLTWIQFFQAEELNAMTGNRRAVLDEYAVERGPILAGTEAAAQSVPNSGELKYVRQYPNGELYAPATGFYSLLYGSTGLEKTENEILSGEDDRFFASRLQQLVAGLDQQGGIVTTTLDPQVQAAAAAALGDWQGAVAAIDPRSGAILAMVQSPSFDPNIIASTDTAAAQAYYEELLADEREPMLNRPIVSLKPPGSTFKVVVSAAALESGEYTPKSVLPGPATYTLPGTSTTVPNYFNGPCGPNNQVTLEDALAISCNTAFAWLGVQLGEDALRAQAQKFGFDTSFEIPLAAAAARFPEDPDEAQLALSSIGQFEVRAHALAMAQVAAAVANDGVTLEPNLIASISAPDLKVLESLQPRTFAQAMTPQHAKELQDMMVRVVNTGTGSAARIPGVVVGGKTGEAETDVAGEPNIAWFIAFAPADNPEVAVAVAVEDAGTFDVSGNGLAGPIARKVMEAALDD